MVNKTISRYCPFKVWPCLRYTFFSDKKGWIRIYKTVDCRHPEHKISEIKQDFEKKCLKTKTGKRTLSLMENLIVSFKQNTI